MHPDWNMGDCKCEHPAILHKLSGNGENICADNLHGCIEDNCECKKFTLDNKQIQASINSTSNKSNK